MKSGKAQYLISALELQNQGLFAGDISRLSIDIQNQGEILNNVTVKMKLSSLSALTDTTYETDNFTTVYNNSNVQTLQGVTIFDFLQPFYWNGYKQHHFRY